MAALSPKKWGEGKVVLMQPVRTNRIADSADFVREFGVSRETAERLTVYATLLAKWQKTINLVAPSTLPEVWHRHFADSAQAVRLAAAASARIGVERIGGGIPEGEGAPLVPESDRRGSPPPHPSPTRGEGVTQVSASVQVSRHWLDLGSGGGFPGVVAGIMLADANGGSRAPSLGDATLDPTYGAWRLTMIESDQRKCAFLREVVRETGLKAAIAVDIVADRIESPANHSRVGHVDVVSARALAALPQLLTWAQPFFGPDTVGVFLKGKDAAAEAAGTGPEWQIELVPSVTDVEARVCVVRRSASK